MVLGYFVSTGTAGLFLNHPGVFWRSSKIPVKMFQAVLAVVWPILGTFLVLPLICLCWTVFMGVIAMGKPSVGILAEIAVGKLCYVLESPPPTIYCMILLVHPRRRRTGRSFREKRDDVPYVGHNPGMDRTTPRGIGNGGTTPPPPFPELQTYNSLFGLLPPPVSVTHSHTKSTKSSVRTGPHCHAPFFSAAPLARSPHSQPVQCAGTLVPVLLCVCGGAVCCCAKCPQKTVFPRVLLGNTLRVRRS